MGDGLFIALTRSERKARAEAKRQARLVTRDAMGRSVNRETGRRVYGARWSPPVETLAEYKARRKRFHLPL